MPFRSSKTLALLGGVATLALGSTFMLRITAPKPKAAQLPCRPRLLALEQAACGEVSNPREMFERFSAPQTRP